MKEAHCVRSLSRKWWMLADLSNIVTPGQWSTQARDCFPKASMIHWDGKFYPKLPRLTSLPIFSTISVDLPCQHKQLHLIAWSSFWSLRSLLLLKAKEGSLCCRSMHFMIWILGSSTWLFLWSKPISHWTGHILMSFHATFCHSFKLSQECFLAACKAFCSGQEQLFSVMWSYEGNDILYRNALK